MNPYWQAPDGAVTLHLGDCLDVMRQMPDASVDAVVTDPPGAIKFMGRKWDGDRGGRDQWIAWLAERMEQACRVLKPGGHALVWSLPRTSGWTQMALEDAGFEVRDCIVHIFGSGHPKALSVAKAIASGGGRPEDIRRMDMGDDYAPSGRGRVNYDHGAGSVMNGSKSAAPLPPEALAWNGWATALKPGQEMWWLVRKPLAGRTVAATVLEHGTGALHIAACRVGSGERTNNAGGSSSLQRVSRVESGYRPTVTASEGEASEVSGRWPANLVFTHSAACEPVGMRKVRNRSGSIAADVPSLPVDAVYGDRERVGWQAHGDADGLEAVEAWDCAPDCPVGELDRQSGVTSEKARVLNRNGARQMEGWGLDAESKGIVHGGSGGASRFFHAFRYQAKAPASERPRLEDGSAHETVKSQGLMQFLVRLICPPGGTVLDCFAGSGATATACLVLGFNCVLIDDEEPHAELIRVRLRKDIQPDMFGGAA